VTFTTKGPKIGYFRQFPHNDVTCATGALGLLFWAKIECASIRSSECETWWTRETVDFLTMDVCALQLATASTNSASHMKALHDTVIEQFSHDQSIHFIQRKKVRAQQTIMMKNYLMKYSVDGLFRDLREVLDALGNMRPYVETCLIGIIRSAQTKIYQLYTFFDTDNFRMEHMSVKHSGGRAEEYWDRASDLNNWRSKVNVEIDKMIATFTQDIVVMEERAKTLQECAFVAHAEYDGFYDKEKQDGPTKKKSKKDGK